MNYFLIPVLCILASLKVIIQNYCAKRADGGFAKNVYFNCLMFSAIGIFFAPYLFLDEISTSTVIAGISMGLLSVGFQSFYMQAFSNRSMALSAIINNFSMLIPTAVSVILFDEMFGALSIIGATLALVSLFLNTSKGSDEASENHSRVKWIIYISMAFVCNGLISVDQKLYTKLTDSFNVYQFVAAAYITAAVLSWMFFAVVRHKEGDFSPNKTLTVGAFGAGIILGVFQCLNTYAASVINGSVLYPVYNCGVSIMLAAEDVLIFKERLSRKQAVGIAVGIASIVFLCI